MVERPEFTIVRCRRQLLDGWLVLRQALWPHRTPEYHKRQIRNVLGFPDRGIGFLALAQGVGIGFAEAVLRTDHVNGCSSSPVAFLEGIYVQPAWRRRGVARELCRATEAWAVDLGCREFASDAAITDPDAQQAHRGLGFEEMERVVFYRKTIASDPRGTAGGLLGSSPARTPE